MPEKDDIKRICSVLNIDDKSIITFEDFVEAQYGQPYKKVKNNPEIKMLREAWNISCESLLTILNGISEIAKQINVIKGK